MSPSRPARKRTSKKSEPAAAPRPFVAHLLVPPHELLSEEESKRTLATLNTSVERLPKILVSDPGLKTDPNFVKLRESGEPLQGRLIRIRRPSQTAGEAVTYRVLTSTLGE